MRKIAAALQILLHGIFGSGSVWTPTVHTLVYDIVHEFCVLKKDLWFGNEQSIESEFIGLLVYLVIASTRSIRERASERSYSIGSKCKSDSDRCVGKSRDL